MGFRRKYIFFLPLFQTLDDAARSHIHQNNEDIRLVGIKFTSLVLQIVKKVSKLIRKFMVQDNSFRRTLALLLVGSYCFTFPLLAVRHGHDVLPRTSTQKISDSIDGNLLPENHSVACVICSRLNSSQAVIAADEFSHQFLHGSEVSVHVEHGENFSAFHLSFSSRAPPIDHTFL